MGEAAVSLLLSPLFLVSWLTSTLLRLLLSAPVLVLSSLYHTLLLLLAGPWYAATVCISLLLSCLSVALYLFHLVLVFGVVAILALTKHKMATGDVANNKLLYQQKTLERHRTVTRLRKFLHRVVQYVTSEFSCFFE